MNSTAQTGPAERIALEEALERFFKRKRTSFMEERELQTKPALTWQCWPSDALVLDLSNDKVREALREGGGPASTDGWWHGFKMSWRPALAFDGLTSSMDRGDAGWATELHADGHLVAGIWTFPELGSQSASPGPGVADFYVDAFRDFAYLAGKVYEAARYTATLHLTSTMHQADKLPLVGGYDRVVAKASTRKTLRWPIAIATVAALPEIGSAMATQFMRIYGRNLPKS